MSRFTLRTFNGHGHRNAVFNDRPLVYSQDLIFFIFRKYQKNWLPICFKTYTIHPLSPFTHKIREAIHLLLKDKDSEYNMKYEELVGSSDDRLIQFVDHIRQVYDNFSVEISATINEIFDITIYVARLSLTFYEKGVREAPCLANEITLIFLDRLPANIYPMLNMHAENVVAAKSHDANVSS